MTSSSSPPASLIVNSPFVEPQRYWAENADRTLRLEEKRRPAGYEIIDTRRQVPIQRVDDIRQRVRQWRTDGWPGVTAVTSGQARRAGAVGKRG